MVDSEDELHFWQCSEKWASSSTYTLNTLNTVSLYTFCEHIQRTQASHKFLNRHMQRSATLKWSYIETKIQKVHMETWNVSRRSTRLEKE